MTYDERDLSHLRMFILDVLRHDDIENCPSILRMLNNRGCIGWREFWPSDFSDVEVLQELRHLAGEGHIQVLREIGQENQLEPIALDLITEIDEHVWFALTDSGRDAWAQWDPPSEDQ